jgi:uncharacterized protein with beta-barrel porin domain
VTHTGQITTLGDGSFGILAQSVGAGGGIGGHGAAGLDGKIAVGGGGGAAGHGGTVDVNLVGNIDTFGVAAHGIFAQSVGGGGGLAGNVDRGIGEFGIGLAFAQEGGGGGNGGAVTVTSTGDIITRGTGSTGIFAQSVGGGGGVGGEVGHGIGFAGSVGGVGSGGAVTVTHTGNITTLGDGAHGIVAQSAGGKNEEEPHGHGGPVAAAERLHGRGGPVGVTLRGSVTTFGSNSDGIIAQSIGEEGNGNITVTIDGGSVQGGSGTGVGVRFMDGADNILTNRGAVTTVGGIAGMAISGTTGNETIENYGTVTGSVDLGTGNNSFENKLGALFNTGATVNLGGGANTLTNAGTLSPGGAGSILTTALAGRLVQAGSGTFAVDVDSAAPRADRISASGTADLAGVVAVNLMNPASATPGTRQVTILSGAGGVTNSGLGLAAPPSAVVNYRLLFPNPTEVALGYTIDFAPQGLQQGLNRNQRAIGGYINSIQLGGGSAGFAPIVATLVGLPDTRSLASAYDRLSPEPYLELFSTTAYSNLGFSDALQSCPERDGAYRFVREGQCGWLRVAGNSLQQDRTTSNLGFNRRGIEFAAGLQKAIHENWHVGFGLAYENSALNVDSLAETGGDQVQGGVVVKGRYGATTFSAAASGGYGFYDSKRFVNLPASGVTAESDQGIGFVSGHLRLGHAFEWGSWYLRPMADAGITHVRLGGFSETGAGGANLSVSGRDETYVTLQPSMEVGGEFALTGGTLVRPYVRAGLTRFFFDTAPGIQATLQGTPAGVAPFTVTGKIDKTYADVSAGFDLLTVGGISLKVGYVGRFSDRTQLNGGQMKLSIPF